jgi:ferric-dicitrate binding protein FerR (iron transport regulator)
MLMIPATIAPELHRSLVQGDREALHRLFDEYAAPLTEAALAEVHAPNAAAHVVEHLFERAWHERRDFSSPEGLHDWLVAETHVMALREAARRASLRRFEGHEAGGAHKAAPVTASHEAAASWVRVVARLDAAEADPAAGHALRRESARHGAAEHIKDVGKGVSTKVMVGGVVACFALASVIGYSMDRATEGLTVTRALADKGAHAVGTRAGQRGEAKLDDGTKVEIGADASVIVPKQFNREFRAVKLLGAARFTVAPNPKLPFEVRAGAMSIVATGTTFTVSAYDDAPVVVSVQEGTVRVTVNAVTRDVPAGQGLVLLANGQLGVPNVDQRDEATAWADGRLVIANRTLKDALPVLKRWYALDLRPDAGLLDRTFWMSSRLGYADSAVTALEQAARVKQVWAGKQMVLVDNPAAATK